jgi:hypothetical protein
MPVQCTGTPDIAMFTCGQFRLAQENTMRTQENTMIVRRDIS